MAIIGSCSSTFPLPAPHGQRDFNIAEYRLLAAHKIGREVDGFLPSRVSVACGAAPTTHTLPITGRRCGLHSPTVFRALGRGPNAVAASVRSSWGLRT